MSELQLHHNFQARVRLLKHAHLFACPVDDTTPRDHTDESHFAALCGIETRGTFPDFRENFLHKIFGDGVRWHATFDQIPHQTTEMRDALFHGAKVIPAHSFEQWRACLADCRGRDQIDFVSLNTRLRHVK